MLSFSVGRMKITRRVEVGLPVPARSIPQATSAALCDAPRGSSCGKADCRPIALRQLICRGH
jgi:hypothetical protein